MRFSMTLHVQNGDNKLGQRNTLNKDQKQRTAQEGQNTGSNMDGKTIRLTEILVVNLQMIHPIFKSSPLKISEQSINNFRINCWLAIIMLKRRFVKKMYNFQMFKIWFEKLIKQKLNNLMILFVKYCKRFCSRKFYDLLAQDQDDLLPENPEDAVLSKFISFQQEKNNKFNSSSKINPPSWQKPKEKLDYNDLLNGSPYGSVQNFTFKNHDLALISTNYYRVEEKKLHKALFNFNPDAILIQRRPEYFLRHFQLLPKGADGIFSDRAYLDQLSFTQSSIKQPEKSSSPLVNALNKNQNDVLEKNPQKQVLQNKGFEVCTKYAGAYNKQIFFGQMPNRSYRQWVANNHTLMQLQQMFKNICRRLPRYKNLKLTPYQMGTLLYSDSLLAVNDHYMATLIEMMIASKKYKRIVGIFGIVENEAVKFILQSNKATNPIINLLVPPAPKSSIVRNIQNLQIIEKHILLDIMFEGEQIVTIPTKYLHTTNLVIKMYGDELDKQTLMKFRYDKTMEYLKLMQSKIKEGEEEIEKQFVRQTLRSRAK